jgi:hypothetical protein
MSRTEVEFLAYCPDYCLKSFTIGIGLARAGRAPPPEMWRKRVPAGKNLRQA